ncbi:MAG TPA: FlgD immunoglobulin-like domain containing protein, partial [Candidatus Udaeobacter sp.]|nr:FlgD immunoglobulin-like domain containing protein [Candidatus Udaeobacter sp.]
TGRGLNITTQSNDGRLDIGFVLPALDLSAVLGGAGAVQFEVPADTVNFPPPLNTQIVPGIMTMPSQTEFFILTFAKPVYKIDLADQTTQSLFCASGRIAIADLGTIGGDDPFALLNAFEMREVGIERNRSITNGAVIDVDVDLNLARTITVSFGNVPVGNTINAASAARIPTPGGDRYVLYDGKNAVFGPATSLLLSGLNPAGDLADAVNALVATHSDTTESEPMSAIVKRDGFTLPVTLTMSSFLLPPAINQVDLTFTFSDATNPGISPTPTWSQSVFRLTAAPGATGVQDATCWIVYAPAASLGFTLPQLPPSAPPGLPNPASTPEDDRVRLTLDVNNTSGNAQAVLHDPIGDATHVTSRSKDVIFATTGLPSGVASRARAQLGTAHPNPFNPSIALPLTAESDGMVTVLVHDASGRCVRRLSGFARAGKTITLQWDGRDERGVRLGSGTYLVRVLGAPGEEAKIVLLK